MEWFLAHLIGDYLLQNDWMNRLKTERSLKGELACHIHAMIWTLCILVFTGWWDWLRIVLLYISHYLLDRTPLIEWYVNHVNRNKPVPWLYAVNDFVLHILILYLIARYLS